MNKEAVTQKSLKVAKTAVLFIGQAVLASIGVYISGMTMKNLITSYLKIERSHSNK